MEVVKSTGQTLRIKTAGNSKDADNNTVATVETVKKPARKVDTSNKITLTLPAGVKDCLKLVAANKNQRHHTLAANLITGFVEKEMKKLEKFFNEEFPK
jgi:hypothetical protein